MTGNLSKKPPVDAEAGKDGVSVSRAFVQNGNLYLVLTDNRTLEVGHVKGDRGSCGVHVGTAPPTDEGVRIWVDPSDNEVVRILSELAEVLKCTDGEIEVDLSTYMKEEEAADKLGLTYIPVEMRYTDDENHDPYYYISAPHIEEIKAGTTIHAIFPFASGSEALSVNDSALAEIKRYASDSSSIKTTIPELGGFVELVYDGEDWICTNLVKPVGGDIDGFIQMRADIDYLADYLGVELP